jgi:hypothetical protein
MIMQPRIYAYKVTFEEVSYYYYGIKKEKVFNEEYWGSPKTNAKYWELYTPEKQILQTFDYTDVGWIEAQELEKRLIRPVYNTDKWCLNRNCGGMIALKINRDVGKVVGKENKKFNRGIFGMTDEEKFQQRSVAGKISGNLTKERKTGIFGMSEEQKLNHNRKAGKIGGNKMKELSLGIFAMTDQEKLERNKKGAKVLNATKWQCTVTGFISTSGPLTTYQRSRGIDPENRIKLTI